MKLPLSWLKEHIRLTGAEARTLSRRLPEIGIEIASEEQVGDGDVVLDVEITANRGDLLSINGLAREIGAVLGRKVLPPKIKPYAGPIMRGAVRIDKNCGCRRYLAARIVGARVGPSPKDTAGKLQLAGFASFNNVVDITNLVLAEFGQPLHTFDADKLSGPVHVRRARPGEKIKALDGKTYDLDRDLVIADESGPVALAGVIGGAATAVSDSTKTVFLECAWFEPAAVRRAARRLGIVTESSYRFERHVDGGGMERAFFMAIDLIEKMSGGRLAGIEKVGVPPKSPSAVAMSCDAADRLLGVRVAPQFIARSLSALGCKLAGAGADRWRVTPPSFRPDLQRTEDLIEEVSRLYGIDRIPSRAPTVRPARILSENRRTIADVRRSALASGLSETVHMSFVSAAALKSVGVSLREAVALENPLSQAVSHLRPTLLPGLLSTASLNIRRGASAVRLFETGPVFLTGKPAKEELRVAIVLYGEAAPLHFSRAPRSADFFDLKGILEEILAGSGRCPERPECVPAEISGFDPAESAGVMIGETAVGCLGRISRGAATFNDLPAGVFAAEVSLSRILSFKSAARVYRPLPRFPSIRRDLSLVVKNSVTAAQVRRVVADAGLPDLTRFDVFDLYRGKGLPAGSYAIGLSFMFRSPDRTLSDEEANASRDAVLALLAGRLGAALRAGQAS